MKFNKYIILLIPIIVFSCAPSIRNQSPEILKPGTMELGAGATMYKKQNFIPIPHATLRASFFKYSDFGFVFSGYPIYKTAGKNHYFSGYVSVDNRIGIDILPYLSINIQNAFTYATYSFLIGDLTYKAYEPGINIGSKFIYAGISRIYSENFLLFFRDKSDPNYSTKIIRSYLGLKLKYKRIGISPEISFIDKNSLISISIFFSDDFWKPKQ